MKSKYTEKEKNENKASRTLCRFLALVWLTIAIGCAPLAVKYPGTPKSLPEPRSFLAAVLQKADQHKHLSGLARLKIRSPGGKLSPKEVVFVQRPSSLRLETLGFLSRPALIFVTDGNRMCLFNHDDNTFYSGTATSENLAKVFGVELRAQDAVHLFLGFPKIKDFGSSAITWQQHAGYYEFTLTSPNEIIQHLRIDPALKRIVQYELCDKLQKTLLEFSFGKFKRINGLLFPLTIELKFVASQTEIKIHYDDKKINITDPPAEDLFSLIPPPQARQLPLQELF